MVMMLPFLSALLAIVFAMRGQRSACVALWLVTFVVFAAWCYHHMTGTLPITL